VLDGSHRDVSQGKRVATTKTETKLEEARFFLDRLEESHTELPDSQYYLSAFVSSARSVLWIMRAEFCRVPGWETWYDNRESGLQDEGFLKRFNDLRVRSTKVEPVRPSSQTLFILQDGALTPAVREYLSAYGDKKHRFILERVADSEVDEPVVEDGRISLPLQSVRRLLVVDEFPGQDILRICREYMNWLGEIVAECCTRFGPA
jgi:hypothetical protein